MQQQHTWTSSGSQHQNNKQTKVCRSLTRVYCAWPSTPQTDKKKTSKRKYGDVERSLVNVMCMAPSLNTRHLLTPSGQTRTSSLNRYGPGVTITQPNLKYHNKIQRQFERQKMPLQLNEELFSTMLATGKWG